MIRYPVITGSPGASRLGTHEGKRLFSFPLVALKSLSRYLKITAMKGHCDAFFFCRSCFSL